MRLVVFLLSLSLLSICSAADVAVGQPIPIVKVKLLDTKELVQIGDKAGKVTIINFWATWCAPCREEMPALQAYYEKYKGRGLEIIAVSMDDPKNEDQVRKIAKSFSFSVALKNDSDFKGLGRIWRLPSTFVIDRNGILQKNGHTDEPTVDLVLLESLVTPLLNKR